MKTLTRAYFVKGVLSTLGVAALVSGCGDDDDDTPGTGGTSNGTGGTSNGTGGTTSAFCASGSVTTEIGSNHGHTLTVPLADVMSGVAKSYMLTTGNNHTHMVQVTPADFSALKSSGSLSDLITVADSTGHMHTIMLSCTD